MQWRARVVAPVLAGVLGVTGGALTAALTGAAAPAVVAFDDPLHLGVPLVNQDCSGGYLLVVGHGNGPSALGPGVGSNRKDGVHYLQTNQSCQAQFGPDGDKHPTYVAYRGPYATAVAPCEIRMSKSNRFDLVAALQPGQTQLIKCPCVLSDAPTLSPGTRGNDSDDVWARSLQTMLRDYAKHEGDSLTGPNAPPAVSGYYDEPTRRYILQRFQAPAGYLTANGLMDTATWGIVTRRICPIYDESAPDSGA